MKYGIAVLLFVILLFPAGARADQFDLTWTGTSFGNGSAVVNATSLGGGEYLITSIVSGTQNGMAITLLGVGAYGENNNDLFPASTPKLTDDGFAFTTGSVDYDILFPLVQSSPNLPNTYYECSSAVDTCMGLAGIVASPLTSFAVAATPEPSSMLLLSAGLLGLMGMVFFRKLLPV